MREIRESKQPFFFSRKQESKQSCLQATKETNNQTIKQLWKQD
jgi:hypothetical protein